MADTKKKTSKAGEEAAAEKPEVEAKDEPVKVRMKIPYIEGEDKELTVGVNGKFTKIKKGVWVDVPPEVAQVIENSDTQMAAALVKQAELENQKFDW